MPVATTVLGALGLVAGLGSAIWSGVQGAKAQKQATEEYNNKLNFLDNTFNQDYYKSVTDRADVQNLLRQMDENQRKQANRDEAVAAVAGSTDEAKLAAQDSRNKAYSDALAQISAANESRKDAIRSQYLTNRMNLNNPSASMSMNTANQLGNAASSFFNVGANMLGSGIDGLISGTGTGTGTKKG